jgi:hypothetical protein
VKRRELIKKLEEEGAVLVRHGGKHDWYSESQDKSVPAFAAAQRDQRISRSPYPAKTFIKAVAMHGSNRGAVLSRKGAEPEQYAKWQF